MTFVNVKTMHNYWYNRQWCYGDVMFQIMNMLLLVQNVIGRNCVGGIFITIMVALTSAMCCILLTFSFLDPLLGPYIYLGFLA